MFQSCAGPLELPTLLHASFVDDPLLALRAKLVRTCHVRACRTRLPACLDHMPLWKPCQRPSAWKCCTGQTSTSWWTCRRLSTRRSTGALTTFEDEHAGMLPDAQAPIRDVQSIQACLARPMFGHANDRDVCHLALCTEPAVRAVQASSWCRWVRELVLATEMARHKDIVAAAAHRGGIRNADGGPSAWSDETRKVVASVRCTSVKCSRHCCHACHSFLRTVERAGALHAAWPCISPCARLTISAHHMMLCSGFRAQRTKDRSARR